MIEALEQRKVAFTGSDSGKFLFTRDKKARRRKRGGKGGDVPNKSAALVYMCVHVHDCLSRRLHEK